jgi:putative membrane protein
MFEAFGYLSAQMLVHILLMNAVAPALALGASKLLRKPGPELLIPAVIVQLALLWAWHAPPVLNAVMRSGDGLHLVMQASLLLSAVVFWSAVLLTRENHCWRAILWLLLTSKLFCLLGVLLVFAPRVLYSGIPAGSGHGAAHAVSLADQQLAGLFMLVACPVTYITAGIVIAARWLGRIDAADRAGSPLKNARHAV